MERIEFKTADNRYTPPPKPSSAQVDYLADELVRLYNAPDYRPWYCLVINKLGIEKVEQLISKAKEGKTPAKLFSYLAKEALGKING